MLVIRRLRDFRCKFEIIQQFFLSDIQEMDLDVFPCISVQGDIVLQSDSKISLRVGGSFVVIHSGGVDIKGAKINLNGGGSPGDVILPMRPVILKAAAGSGTMFVAHCPKEDK